MTAVVFAYHNVGLYCLCALLDQNVKVPLVVTHLDNASENIWFASVADFARSRGIPVVTPESPNDEALIAQVRSLRPDFIFSFYYRQMMGAGLLAIPRLGALNMHGSLLPKYRGRVPVNWAVIRGETQTGATLHYMSARPDAGDIVDQQAVPILPDDTAYEVFQKVADAAKSVVARAVPALIAGTAPRIVQNLAAGSYFGGRKPEDGLVDWTQPARDIHNLVRGVAPPYPGAYTMIRGTTLKICRTRVEEVRRPGRPRILVDGDACFAVCGDQGVLRLLELEHHGQRLAAADFSAKFGMETALLEQ